MRGWRELRRHGRAGASGNDKLIRRKRHAKKQRSYQNRRRQPSCGTVVGNRRLNHRLDCVSEQRRISARQRTDEFLVEKIRISTNTGRHLFVIRLPGLLNFRGETRK